MTQIRTLLAWALGAVLLPAGAAAASLITPVAPVAKGAGPEGVLVRIDPAVFSSLSKSSGKATALPLPDGSAMDFVTSPKLEPLTADGATVEVVTQDGSYFLPLPAVTTVYGEGEADPDSSLKLTEINGLYYGTVKVDGLSYSITPAEQVKGDGLHHLGFDSQEPKEFKCPSAPPPGGSGAGSASSASPLPPAFAPLAVEEGTLSRLLGADRAITIALEANSEYYRARGSSVDNATDYYLALLSDVSAIYERDLQTRLVVTNFRLFTDAAKDPYKGNSSITYLEQLVSAIRATTVSSIRSADLVHLVSVSGKNLGGVAWLDVLCNRSGFNSGYSDIDAVFGYPSKSYSWDVNVVAHELGHNFSSPHTHCYNPPIDKCFNRDPASNCYTGPVESSDGEIMSYCHLLNGRVSLVFRSVVAAQMRGAVIASGSCAASVTRPANDNSVDGVWIANLTNSNVTRSSTGATTETREPSHAGSPPSASVWFRLRAPLDDPISLTTTGSKFDTILAVYTKSGNTFTEIASNNNRSATDKTSQLEFAPTRGTGYYIAIDGVGGATGEYTLGWSYLTAGNDMFARARQLTIPSGVMTNNSAQATKEGGEPSHAGDAGGRSLWYYWIAGQTADVTLSTEGSTFDTILGVYTGNTVSTLVLIASNDDAPGAGARTFSRLTFNAQAGTRYAIAVDGYRGRGSSAGSGLAKITWTSPLEPPSPTPTSTPSPSVTPTPSPVPSATPFPGRLLQRILGVDPLTPSDPNADTARDSADIIGLQYVP